MTRSLSGLADALDILVENRNVALTETCAGLFVYQLSGAQAKSLLVLMAAVSWPVEISDAAGQIDPALIADDDKALTLHAEKPGIPADVEAILTRAGLKAALERQDLGGKVWIYGLKAAFETLTTRFAPWDDMEGFAPVELPASPRKVVRVLDDGTNFPDDLGRWLLRDPGTRIGGTGVRPWRRMAVERLAQALADEIEPDGNVLFRGPPAMRFTPSAGKPIPEADLEAIERAAQWVFDNPREVENRHALLAAEIARTTLSGGDAADIASVAKPALEGAKIAYNFGVTQQSKDTLKALSDLRKAVSDETAKLAETTRSLATAVAASVVANLGIIIARLTMSTSSKWVPDAAIAVAVVLAIYVATMIGSSAYYLCLQRALRTEWRDRLYRFLETGDYNRMVAKPVARAELGFWIAAGISVIMTLLLLFAVYRIAGAATPIDQVLSVLEAAARVKIGTMALYTDFNADIGCATGTLGLST